MRQAIPVRIGSAELLVETTEPARESGGLTPVSGALPDQPETFDRVREAIEAIAGELAGAWERVRPAEATVEFGVNADISTGKLTGLIVGGGAAASLKVTVKWTAAPAGK